MIVYIRCEMAQMIRCVIIALLLLPVPGFVTDVNDAHSYTLLIKDVRNYYGTSCIVIVHSDNSTDFNYASLTYIWTRAFSQQGILTMVVSFSRMSRETKKYRDFVMRPLYVVILTTNETMNEFSTVSRQIDISFPAWLVLFLPSYGNPMWNFCMNPVGNPFGLKLNTEMLVLCYDAPVLKEWYALRDNQTKTFSLATWKPGERLRLTTKLGLYARRSNMFGETIRVSIVEESLFVEFKDGVLSRLYGSVLEELSKMMNFTIEVTSFMSMYGSWSEEERMWTGVIGDVASNKVDLGLGEFSMTSHRMEAVDFTLPLLMSRNRIYFKKPGTSTVQWSAYFKIFHENVWMAIICLAVFTPIPLTLMKTKGRIAINVLADNYVYVWGIYCQQGLSDFPRETSMRLAYLSIFVSALIVLSAYSASLISFLTVSTYKLPFSTIEEFAAHGSYKLIVFKNSADYDMIISSENTILAKMKRLLKKNHDLPLTAEDGFATVCTEKVGFYVTEAIKDAMGRIPCDTVFIEAGEVDSLSMVLNKGSQYTQFVNYNLQRYKDVGVLNKLKSTFLVTNYHEDYPVVTLDRITPILSILVGGMLLGCLVLAVEKIYYKYLCKYKRSLRFSVDLNRNKK
ncbi:glutamate receptor 2-like [Ceratina calcarata]|uniref:Glutamate receptor 2-like n=2 Tax=Ceratina calcarata TaxID=156304 RepID=A0AAJ7JE67_9HYME|nr:glutamate receptor 2-like [Ceratina calcarata]